VSLTSEVLTNDEVSQATESTVSGVPPKRPVGGFLTIEKAVPVAVQIANQLELAIVGGDFSVGGLMPSETILAKQFGVGRASVREALSSLQFSGYIQTVRGRGSVVVSATAIGRQPVRNEGIRRPSDLIDVLEARLTLEPQVVAYGALDPKPGALATVGRMVAGMELSLSAAEHASQTDLGLHRALVHCCRNSVLVDAADSLIARTDGPLWRRVRDASWNNLDLLKGWLTHHINMAQAVIERDAEHAEMAAREHLVSVLTSSTAHARLGSQERRRVTLIVERYRPVNTSGTYRSKRG